MLLGLILDSPGIIVVPWESDLGGPGLHFKSPGAPHGYIFFDLAAILLKMQKSHKNLVFLWFFNDFKSPEGRKINEKPEKIEPGVFGNATILSGTGRID